MFSWVKTFTDGQFGVFFSVSMLVRVSGSAIVQEVHIGDTLGIRHLYKPLL